MLKLELGAVGVFKGTAEFSDNSIISTSIDESTEEEILRKGGAIHTKVRTHRIQNVRLVVSYSSAMHRVLTSLKQRAVI